MKNMMIKINDGNPCFQRIDKQILSIDARQAHIECLQGMIWVTWPDGNERVLVDNQSISVTSKGLICIQAFSPSAITIRREVKDNLCVH